MILFNVLAILYGKGSTKMNTLKVQNYKQKIKSQFLRIKDNLPVEEEHVKFLKKKLRKGNELVIFDTIVTSYKRRENPYINDYLDACKDIFIELMYYYVKKNNTEKAYYLSVVRDYNALYKNNKQEIDFILFDTLQDKSFYCRDNAYLAICKMADPYKMKDALLQISNSNKFFHQNLIVNGLIMYNGEKELFLKLLLDNFNLLRNDIKCCVIEYFAYSKIERNEFVLEVFTSSNNPSLKISCLKYFEYIFCKEAEPLLITCVNETLEKDFELSYASIKSLRNYHTKDSIETIKKAAYSTNFRIRDIACESLAVIRLGVDAKDLEEFITEEDVYDIYQYHIHKNLEKTVK